MVKVLSLLFVALLILQETSVSVTVSIHKKALTGDPAPGRSPGPPAIGIGTSEDQSNLILTSSQTSSVDCILVGEARTIEEGGELELTVNHNLFRTDLLTPAVVYESESIQCIVSTEKFKSCGKKIIQKYP